MGWTCRTCGETSADVTMRFPVTHELRTGHADVEPDDVTARAWSRALGVP